MEGINLRGKITWKKKRGAPLPQSQGFFFSLSPFLYFLAFALILWTLKFDSHQLVIFLFINQPRYASLWFGSYSIWS